MNVVQVAELCSIVNRAYCSQLGDESIPDWFGAPSQYHVTLVAGVQFVLAGLRKGVHIAAWDVHGAWMRSKIDEGWQHGEETDTEKKTHARLVPFDKLPADEQRKYYLYVAVIEACYRAGVDA